MSLIEDNPEPLIPEQSLFGYMEPLRELVGDDPIGSDHHIIVLKRLCSRLFLIVLVHIQRVLFCVG